MLVYRKERYGWRRQLWTNISEERFYETSDRVWLVKLDKPLNCISRTTSKFGAKNKRYCRVPYNVTTKTLSKPLTVDGNQCKTARFVILDFYHLVYINRN